MADEIVQYLVDNYTEAEIKAASKQVFEAHLSGLTDNVIITSSTFEGGSASGQVSVSPANREQFLRQCRMAIDQLHGNASTMSNGILIRYDQRRLET